MGFANALPGGEAPYLNSVFEEEVDQIVKHGALVSRWRGRGVRSHVGRMGEGRSGIHGSIFPLAGLGGSTAEELCPLEQLFEEAGFEILRLTDC